MKKTARGKFSNLFVMGISLILGFTGGAILSAVLVYRYFPAPMAPFGFEVVATSEIEALRISTIHWRNECLKAHKGGLHKAEVSDLLFNAERAIEAGSSARARDLIAQARDLTK